MIALNNDGTLPMMENVGIEQKVSRYGWSTEIGDRGKLLQVDKYTLRIDPCYQRGTSMAKARKIAAEFNWLAFGVLKVGSRDDGEMYIIDGSHRAVAATLRSDIKRVPCIVYPDTTQKTEAVGFVSTNKNRRGLVSLETWKAQIVAGDPSTLAALKTLDEHGYHIGPRLDDGTAMKCAQTVLRLSNKGILGDVLSFINDLWPDSPVRSTMPVLSGVAMFAGKLKSISKELGDASVRRCMAMPLESMLRRTRYLMELSSASLAHAITVAMSEQYNKGKHKNQRLALGSIGDDSDS